jgi:hypothetical protein
MSGSSSGRTEEKKTELIYDVNNLQSINTNLLNQSGGISGQSNSTNTASGPKEFKTSSSNTAELINQ